MSGPSPVSSDAFVAKFDATGALVYATCLGGSEIEWATHVAIRRGDVYAAGFTRSRDFPTTSGAFQPAFGGGDCGYGSPSPCNDLFVAKLDPSGSRLTYSSFFGGDNDERPGGLAVDDAGDAYIAGTTRSHNLPTARPLQRACRPAYGNADCGDAFVAKIAATGTALVYSTYLGGSGPDGAEDVAVTAGGTLYVVGWTASKDFPGREASPRAFTPEADVYVARLNPRGSDLEAAVYGGSRSDGAVAVALGEAGVVWVGGATGSPDFPIVGGFPSTFRGQSDGFVLRLRSPFGGL